METRLPAEMTSARRDQGHAPDVGFFDIEGAKARAKAVKNRKLFLKDFRQTYSVTWRDKPRINVVFTIIGFPLRVINYPIAAVLYRLTMAGQDIAELLELHIARLDDISSPSRLQVWMQSLMTWLIAAPNDEPDTTDEDLPPCALSQAFEIALTDLHLKRQAPSSEGSATVAENRPNSDRETQQQADGPLDQTNQGVR